MSSLPTPGELAGRNTDPRFYATLAVLPNPDAVLRKSGRSEEVYDSIEADAHVIGELRLIRADLQRFTHTLSPGGDSPADLRAYEICQSVLDRAPAPGMTWADTIWNIGKAPFRGRSVHEIVWARSGGLLLPDRLLDRPNRRFAYGSQGELRLLTREQPMFGVPAEEAYFLQNRHMPSYDNPYGVALLSSCLWPSIFKNAGYRWFVKFCERFGIPYPVGKVPRGTGDAEVAELSEALEQLLEAAFAVVYDDESIELLEARGTTQGGGKLAQHLLIEACNAEISKALSSQTLSTEQPGAGSRAAAETARGRSSDVNEGDRNSIAYTLDHLWSLITRFNVPNAKPPTSEFASEEAGSKERAEVYEIFIRNDGNPSRRAMAKDLGIQLADATDAEDQMKRPRPAPAALPPPSPIAAAAAEFARTDSGLYPDQDAIDDVDLEQLLQGVSKQLLQPVFDRVKQGVDPAELLTDLAKIYPRLDDRALEDLLAHMIFIAEVWGRLSAEADSDG
jgi:phage gp29-like protein